MDEDAARHLAELLLSGSLPRRWQHVQGVAAEAARLCTVLAVDRQAIVAAAWLHDIGYAPKAADGGFHPLDGARYLRTHGWPSDVCRLVAHHTDAARHADAQGLGDELRAEFPELPGVGQDVLWTADVTTGPDGDRVTLDERIDEIAARYGAEYFVTVQMRKSRSELAGAIARVLEQTS